MIDPAAQEQRQFELGDGALLNKAVSLAEDLFRNQGDFELTSAVETPFGRYAIARPLRHRTDGEQVGLLYMKLEHPNLHVWLKPTDRFTAFQMAPEQIPMSRIDQEEIEIAITKALMALRRTTF